MLHRTNLVAVIAVAAVGPEGEEEHCKDERRLNDRDHEVEVGEKFGAGVDGRREGEGGAGAGECPVHEERGRADAIGVVGSEDETVSVSYVFNSNFSFSWFFASLHSMFLF